MIWVAVCVMAGFVAGMVVAAFVWRPRQLNPYDPLHQRAQEEITRLELQAVEAQAEGLPIRTRVKMSEARAMRRLALRGGGGVRRSEGAEDGKLSMVGGGR